MVLKKGDVVRVIWARPFMDRGDVIRVTYVDHEGDALGYVYLEPEWKAEVFTDGQMGLSPFEDGTYSVQVERGGQKAS
jgi:hypothetical protein